MCMHKTNIDVYNEEILDFTRLCSVVNITHELQSLITTLSVEDSLVICMTCINLQHSLAGQ